MLKRAFDVVFALMLLVLLWIPMLVVALAVMATMGLPVLFRQERPGLHGRPFLLVKFRTMTNDTDDKDGALRDEVRLTRVGRILRNTSLDELPQLFNVIRGDLSFVGPRPLLMEYLPRYTCEQARRHEVKPGITGWAQVNGRNALSWEERFKLDVWYVDHRSFGLDMRILWLTARSVLRREGISAPGHETMPKFRGTAGLREEDVE
jgi:sugar transferase EpsL